MKTPHENGGSDDDSDNQMMIESVRVVATTQRPADKPAVDSASTSGTTVEPKKTEKTDEAENGDRNDSSENIKISNFAEIDKNEEVPSSLDYKSNTNFTHGKHK